MDEKKEKSNMIGHAAHGSADASKTEYGDSTEELVHNEQVLDGLAKESEESSETSDFYANFTLDDFALDWPEDAPVPSKPYAKSSAQFVNKGSGVQIAENKGHVESNYHFSVFGRGGEKGKLSNRQLVKCLIIALIVIFAFVAGLFAAIKTAHYKSAINKAIALLESNKPLEAVPYYKEASQNAIGKSRVVYAKYYEASCYYYEYYYRYFFTGQRDPLIQKNACDLLTQIIYNPNYKGLEYYYDAVSLRCDIYHHENASTSTPEWVSLIDILEKRYDKLSSLFVATVRSGEFNTSVITQMQVVVLPLSLYYRDNMIATERSDKNKANVQKAQLYGGLYLETTAILDDLGMHTNWEVFLAQNYQYVFDLLSSVYLYDNKNEICDIVIEQSEAMLADLTNAGQDTNLYLEVKSLLGKAYLMKGMSLAVYNNELLEAFELFTKAYAIFRELLDLPIDYETDGRTMLYAGINLCNVPIFSNEDDIERAVQVGKRAFAEYKYDNIRTMISDKQLACSVCRKWLLSKGYIDYVFEYGNDLLKDLRTYREYTDQSVDEATQSIRDLEEFYSQDVTGMSYGDKMVGSGDDYADHN